MKDGMYFMKRFFYFILAAIILLFIFNSEAAKNTYLYNKSYAALTSISKTAVLKNSSSKWNSDIEITRKKSVEKQASQKKEAPKNLFEQSKIKNSGIINIVFFGLDGGNKNGYSRSDSIMVVSIDEKKNKLKVTSLMRDMYLPIPGKGKNRINAAYAFGGPSLAVKTINTNFGLDIKNYVTIDFLGLEKLIDNLGGIKINLTKAEADVLNIQEEQFDYTAANQAKKLSHGVQSLNGRQAVAYCRIRYVGHGDYERTERQRRVLNELLSKLKENGVKKLPETIRTMLPYVKTNLSAGDILKLGIKGIGLKTDSVLQYRLPVDGTYKSQSINGMAVLVPDIDVNRNKLLEFIYE